MNYLNKPGRILFATVPGDGHVNPLTGLAAHLKNIGYDVRWYTSITYAEKLSRLQIQHYPLKRAFDLSSGSPEEMFPERMKIKSQVKKLAFDLTNGFILRSTEYFEDIKEIYQTFPFDLVICDCAFTAIPFIKEKLDVPVISIGVLPLTETSKDLGPMGLAMMPSNTFFGRRKQDVLRFVADKILFHKPNKIFASLLAKYNIKMQGSNLFDCLVRTSTLLLQSGTPNFEYKRGDLGKNIRFVGALLPYTSSLKQNKWTHEKLKQYTKIILVTQGTVEKDVTKLLIPTLEALKNSEHLIIATTGGSNTEMLREKYPHSNIIIEDFIPFEDVMPLANMYITNGGYGGVMLAIENTLPMIVAGVHEGKAEINARIEYFKLGVNLRTETPTPTQLKASVEKIFSDTTYTTNVETLSNEFNKYHPNQLCAGYIDEILHKEASVKFLNQKTQQLIF